MEGQKMVNELGFGSWTVYVSGSSSTTGLGGRGLTNFQRLPLRSTGVQVLLLNFSLPLLTQVTQWPFLVSARIWLTPPFFQRLFRWGSEKCPYTQRGKIYEWYSQNLNPELRPTRQGLLHSSRATCINKSERWNSVIFWLFFYKNNKSRNRNQNTNQQFKNILELTMNICYGHMYVCMWIHIHVCEMNMCVLYASVYPFRYTYMYVYLQNHIEVTNFINSIHIDSDSILYFLVPQSKFFY